MKKLLIGFIVILYFFTTSMLTHAQTMGFFPHSSNTTNNHCHSEKNKSNGNINCCETALSNNYSESKINIQTISKNIIQDFLSTCHSQDNIIKVANIKKIKPKIASSPGYYYDIKYHQFSDLFGIIISLS